MEGRQSYGTAGAGLAAGQSEQEPLLSPPTEIPSASPHSSLALKTAATMYSFLVLGAFTATTGVLIPLLEEYYDLTDTQASLVFLTVPVGYILAAQNNELIHSWFGQRGIAVVGPLCHLLSALGAGAHPAFPLYLVFFAVGAFGIGILDGSWASWAGALPRANTVSGLLHGSFSIGAAFGPLALGALISGQRWPWYQWYYLLAGLCVLELASLFYVFRLENAQRYKESKLQHGAESTSPTALLPALRSRAVWISAAYILLYVGTESSISGWIVVFMSRARHASALMSSICSSCFWTGMAVGRLSLGSITDQVGTKKAVVAYLLAAIGLGFPFAMVDNARASAALLAMIGFFLGPLFPAGIVQLTLVTEPAIHVSAVSFVSSMGQIGGAALPFAIGIITDKIGIRSFQVVILVQLVLTLIAWLLVPSQPLRGVDEYDEDEE